MKQSRKKQVQQWKGLNINTRTHHSISRDVERSYCESDSEIIIGVDEAGKDSLLSLVVKSS